MRAVEKDNAPNSVVRSFMCGSVELMQLSNYFSETYEVARSRFRRSVTPSARQFMYSIGDDKPSLTGLTIDVAILGNMTARKCVLVSSGLHGVEGFLGSAIQSAWLEIAGVRRQLGAVRLVMVHGLNPYGFREIRRVNEANVDLNRNFLPDKDYRGAPKGYAALNDFLNPSTPPSRAEFFRLRLLWRIIRHGMKAFKESVAGGQYSFPRGLFFGGGSPSRSMEIVAKNLTAWVGDATEVIHIDFHSGLGKFGRCKLLVLEPPDASRLDWYRKNFDPSAVEPLNSNGVAYAVRGSLGGWARKHLASKCYRFIAAEFGTYSIFRVLAALRTEQRAAFYCSPADAQYEAAKKELLECFCPANSRWRARVIHQGLRIIDQAFESES